MTKKPSEKNKAWEKDRRDRLNKSFEELAKLLPKYDPTILWSKIEIIQKSVTHIKDLQERHEEYLRDNDPDTLNQYSDLIDSLKYYQSRNGQLANLLKKAKISLPPFKLPKFLVDNPKHDYKNGLKRRKTATTNTSTTTENENESTTKNQEKSICDRNTEDAIVEKATNTVNVNGAQNNNNVTENLKKDEQQTNTTSKTQQIVETIEQTNNVTQKSAIITTGIFVPLVPVQSLQTTNPASNLTIPLPPPKQNMTEIPLPTPLSGVINTPKTILSSLTLPSTTAQTTILRLPTTNTITLQKIGNRFIIQNPKRVYRRIARDKDGKIKILPQPRLKVYFQRSDGKVPIPVLKSNNIPSMKRKRQRRKRKALNAENSDNFESIKTECKNGIKKQKLENNKNEKKIENSKETEKSIEDKCDEDSTLYTNKTENNVNEDSKSNENENKNIFTQSSNHEISTQLVDIENNLEKLDKISNNGSVSPTAAFLLSFPVVTATTTTITTTTTECEMTSIVEKSINTQNSQMINTEKVMNSNLNDLAKEKLSNEIEKKIDDEKSNKQMKIDEIDSNAVCKNNAENLIPINTENQLIPITTTSVGNKNSIADSNTYQTPNVECRNLETPVQLSDNQQQTISSEQPPSSIEIISSAQIYPPTNTTQSNIFPTFKTTPTCNFLPLRTVVSSNSFCDSTASQTNISSTVSLTAPLVESLPSTFTTTDYKTTSSIMFPNSIPSYQKNPSSSVVETTWCSLNTIPSVDTARKDYNAAIAPLSTSNLSNIPETITTSTTFISNTQATSTNSQINLNTTNFVPIKNVYPITTEISKFTSAQTVSKSVTTGSKTTSRNKQNQKTNAKNNTAITTNSPISLLSQPSSVASVHSSNILRPNVNVSQVTSLVTSANLSPPSSTPFSSISSNQVYSNTFSMNSHTMYPYSESLPHHSLFNQSLPMITNPYSNFPVSNAYPPISGNINSTLNYSSTTNQPLKSNTDTILIPQSISESTNSIAQSKFENNQIYTSKSNTNCISQPKPSNTPYVSSIKTEIGAQGMQLKSQNNNVSQSKSENVITSFSQSKSDNIYNVKQKFGNTNYISQIKSENTLASQNKNGNTAFVSQTKPSNVLHSSELPIVSDGCKTPKVFYPQTQISSSVTSLSQTYPTSSANSPINTPVTSATFTGFYSHLNTSKHSQMYHPSPYGLPLSNTSTAPITSTEFYSPSAINIQTSSPTNLPSNRVPIYPPTNSNPQEFIPPSSPQCTNAFSRTFVTNSLPIYPIAKTTQPSIQLPSCTPTSGSTAIHASINSSTTSVGYTTPTNVVSSAPLLHTSQSSSFSYPFVSSSNIISTYPSSNILNTTIDSTLPRRVSHSSAPTTLSSIYYSSTPNSTPNTSNTTHSVMANNYSSTIVSKQTQSKIVPSIASSQNTQKENFSTPSTAKQLSSFRNYQSKIQTTQASSQRSYVKQTNSNTMSTSSLTTSMATPSTQFVSLSQNSSVPKSMPEMTYSQSVSLNFSTPSSLNSSTINSNSAMQSKPKPLLGVDTSPIYPQVSSGYGKIPSNYPPPSITPLPPPLLSTALPVANDSLSNFHQNPAMPTFVESIDSLKYPTSSSSIVPIESYNRIMESSPVVIPKSSSNKPTDPYISTVPTTPIYSHTSQANVGYCAPNAFYPCASDAIYSPAKNYYYHPIQMQDTPNFSFSLTSTTNSPSTPSSTNATVIAESYTPPVKTEITWMPPPRPASVIPNDYKTPFTFSLTPTTNVTTYVSTTNCSTNNTISRTISAPISTQKVSTPRSMTNVKSKTNYNNNNNNSSNSSELTKINNTPNKIQPSAKNAADVSNFATNFTFSLTHPKTTLTNTESPVYGKSVNFSNDFQQQKQQKQTAFDRSNTKLLDQQRQSVPSTVTNFSFALTKTSNSSSLASGGTPVERSVPIPTSTTTVTTTTNSSSSFTIDATLNESGRYTAPNLNNSRTTPASTITNQTQNSSVFKKPLAEPMPIKGSSSSLSNQNLIQSYYNSSYDQKLQRPPQPPTPALRQKPSVTWMTPSDFGAPPLMDYGCVPTYPPAQIPPPPQTYEYNNRKNDLYYPPFTPNDENFPSWSPNKMLDTTSHFTGTPVSLGNYYGDISSFNGIGNSGNFPTVSIQTLDPTINKSSFSTNVNNNKNSGTNEKNFKNNGATNTSSCSQNSNNFFSVSQLVEQESTTSNTAQKSYENCTNDNSSSNNNNSNSNNNSGNKKISSSLSNKPKDSKKFNASNNPTYTGVVQEQGSAINNTSTNVDGVTNVTSNNYSTEAILTKKDKTVRNYSNVCSTDFYSNMNAATNTLYHPSSTASHPTPTSLISDNMDPNYFYNYATNTSGCLPDTDYLGSIYSGEVNYVRPSSIKPIRKLPPPSTTPIPPSISAQTHQSIPHHHHPPPPPPPTNFVSYDANYYPVPLGVNSPLMPGPGPHHHHHHTSVSDPYGGSTIIAPAPTPHPYMHASSGNFQTSSHAWNPKTSNTVNQYNLQELGHHQQQQQHLFSSEINVNSSNASNNNNNNSNSNNNNSNGNTTSHTQQNQNASNMGASTTTVTSNNLTNFNLTTICPEINNEKVGSNPW